MITPECIARINALARKKKAQGLSPEEQQEQDRLRRVYLDHIKAQLHETLRHIHFVEEEVEEALEEMNTVEQDLPGKSGKVH